MNKINYSKLKRTISLLLSAVIIISLNCKRSSPGYNGSTHQVNPESQNENQPETNPEPDLVISSINVYPEQPTSGQHFTFNVYVKNQGNAKSGEYDLAIFIKDISRNLTYPVGTFRNSALHPGDNVAAFSKNNQLVNDRGSYQIHCEIKPFLFDDGNTDNNLSIWALQAN